MGGSQRQERGHGAMVVLKVLFEFGMVTFFHHRLSLCMPSKEPLGVNYSLKHYFQCHCELVTFFLAASHDLFIVPVLKIRLV